MGTPVQDNPTTGPKTVRADRTKPKSANVISYQPVGARGLNTYSENIPNGGDAIAGFEQACSIGEFGGVKIERCGISVGGTRTSDRSMNGAVEIVSWTPAGGVKGDAGWESKVANPTPKPIAAPAPVREGGDAPPAEEEHHD